MIDSSEAEAMPGVLAVYTGAGIKDVIKPMPQPVVQPNLPGLFPKFWPLAVDKVTFHGEPVALVVARDKYVAEDAAESVMLVFPQRSDSKLPVRVIVRSNRANFSFCRLQ